jgi:predicted methyltransferase
MTGNTSGRLNRPNCVSYSYKVKSYNDYDKQLEPNVKYYFTQQDISKDINISKSSVLKLVNKKPVRNVTRFEIDKIKIKVCDMENHLMNAISSL